METSLAATSPPSSQRTNLRRLLSQDVTGGILLLAATALALCWANSAWRDSYERLAHTVVGFGGLDLTLAAWASDGLLAIFFFVVGAELKHELVAGSLSNRREAAVPVLAAIGGMALPAIVYLSVAFLSGDRAIHDGWAIPTATDIAFALAVLAIFGRGLPVALRLFLLTLAVVDDLLAIVVIAIFYTRSIGWLALIGALLAIAVFALLVRRAVPPAIALVTVALVAWVLMHESGVHATIAGALLGFVLPARPLFGEAAPRTQRYEHLLRPFAAGLALPVFAFFSAGVNVVDGESIVEVVRQPEYVAIVVALLCGKLLGVMGTTFVATQLTRLRLPDAIGMRDLLPIGFLTAMGFTVSLLITELSFEGTIHAEPAKLAVLTATAFAAFLAASTLRRDARRSRSPDMNLDSLPDQNTEAI